MKALRQARGRLAATTAPAARLAVLLGDSMDMAHALRSAGAQTTVVAGRHSPARYSRHGFCWVRDPRPDEARLLQLLPELVPPGGPGALFYETDADLLFVSRNREALGDGLRVVLPGADLVEQLVDKGAFAALARSLDLPVPAGGVVRTGDALAAPGLELPVVVKPLVRDGRWHGHATGQKAVVARTADELGALGLELAVDYASVLVQAWVPGSESSVESYHVYVDPAGEVAAEFSGRKIRSLPVANGFSTALETTDAPDVRALGRAVVAALGLVGVAKLDLKRDGHGRLWLLEVNPRFTLWHHLGAVAGVNIPHVVLADLTGGDRPAPARARAGATWCHVPKDLVAARATGLGACQWAAWARTCDARAGLDPGDPLPFLAGRLLPRMLERVSSSRRDGQLLPVLRPRRM